MSNCWGEAGLHVTAEEQEEANVLDRDSNDQSHDQ